jgi:enamine deaminase RidA (YjgF/YER057c/UK114 family)
MICRGIRCSVPQEAFPPEYKKDKQADQAFRNLEWVLQPSGPGLDRIAKVTIYLTSMSNFEKIVELRRKWWLKPYPADTIVEVSSLYSLDDRNRRHCTG